MYNLPQIWVFREKMSIQTIEGATKTIWFQNPKNMKSGDMIIRHGEHSRDKESSSLCIKINL